MRQPGGGALGQAALPAPAPGESPPSSSCAARRAEPPSRWRPPPISPRWGPRPATSSRPRTGPAERPWRHVARRSAPAGSPSAPCTASCPRTPRPAPPRPTRRCAAPSEALAPHPRLAAAGFLHDAEKEFAEARLTAALVAGAPLPGAGALAVGVAAWLNGLAEAASELRRHLLDRLRAGETRRGEELLETMEDIYDTLVTIEYPDAITGGLRRATDALRAVVERSRADVTTTVLQVALQRAPSTHGTGGRASPDGEGRDLAWHAGAHRRCHRPRTEPVDHGARLARGAPTTAREGAQVHRPRGAPGGPRTCRFTCATMAEMLGLARAGLGDDLLLANEVVDASRLAALARSRGTGERGRRLRGDDRSRRRQWDRRSGGGREHRHAPLRL